MGPGIIIGLAPEAMVALAIAIGIGVLTGVFILRLPVELEARSSGAAGWPNPAPPAADVAGAGAETLANMLLVDTDDEAGPLLAAIIAGGAGAALPVGAAEPATARLAGAAAAPEPTVPGADEESNGRAANGMTLLVAKDWDAPADEAPEAAGIVADSTGRAGKGVGTPFALS